MDRMLGAIAKKLERTENFFENQLQVEILLGKLMLYVGTLHCPHRVIEAAFFPVCSLSCMLEVPWPHFCVVSDKKNFIDEGNNQFCHGPLRWRIEWTFFQWKNETWIKRCAGLKQF